MLNCAQRSTTKTRLARAWEIDFGSVSSQYPGYLNNADLLYWLGLTRSPAGAAFTVQPVAGRQRAIWLTWVGPASTFPRIAYAPFPLYLRNGNQPY